MNDDNGDCRIPQHTRIFKSLVFGHLLRKAGFETSVVSSGDAALDQLSAKGDVDALIFPRIGGHL